MPFERPSAVDPDKGDTDPEDRSERWPSRRERYLATKFFELSEELGAEIESKVPEILARDHELTEEDQLRMFRLRRDIVSTAFASASEYFHIGNDAQEGALRELWTEEFDEADEEAEDEGDEDEE